MFTFYEMGQQAALEKLGGFNPREFLTALRSNPVIRKKALGVALGLGAGAGITAAASAPEHRVRGALLGIGADLGVMGAMSAPEILAALKVIR